MKTTKKLYISINLKDTFIYKGKLIAGMYDGYYRKLFKENISNLNLKTSFRSSLDYRYEIMDSEKGTQIRATISLPSDWTEKRFLQIVSDEINRNPSIDIISAAYISSSDDEQFFSSKWRGPSSASQSIDS